MTRHGIRFAFVALAAAVLALSTAVSATGTGASTEPAAALDDAIAVRGPAASQKDATVVAQSTCFGSISSCKNISSTQKCHATEKVIYTLSRGQWCRTPAPCTC